MHINQIFENNKEWIAKRIAHNNRFFDDLSMPQCPRMLYRGCSDSRVSAEELMGLAPGEVFVHRNIANLVVNTDISMMSTINFAVEHLNVQDIVVCGHYGCGGIGAAMQSADYGILNPWLRNIRDVYRLHKEELNSIKDEQMRYERLAELNVLEQSINVLKTPEVQRAVIANRLNVHGWMFDICTGRLIDLEIEAREILENIMQIYKIV